MPEQINSTKTILVAIDGSPAAQAAAITAIDIARQENLMIHGIYVVDEVLVFDSFINYKSELDEDLRESGDDQIVSLFEEQGSRSIEWLERRCEEAGVPVRSDLLFGGVSESIIERTQGVALAAMGRRGLGHPRDGNHLGRMFRTIAHSSRAPLLVGGEVIHPIERVLLGYDGSEKAKRALSWTRRLQHDFDSSAFVVSVCENSSALRAWLSEMRAEIEQSGLSDFHFLSREGLPNREIVAAAAENQVDLIIMGRYEHSAFVDWFTGSTLDHVLREIDLPLLAA